MLDEHSISRKIRIIVITHRCVLIVATAPVVCGVLVTLFVELDHVLQNRITFFLTTETPPLACFSRIS